jgi:hypothetical protein
MSQKGTDADLINIASTAQGDIYYNNGSAIARLGAGTSGQLLQTGGSGANPSWTDAPSGKVKQVITKTANHNFGTISNDSAYHLSQLDITFTALETDPFLFLSSEVLTDNSNSSTYGVDLGWQVVNNTDGTNVWAYYPNQHPLYIATNVDIYFPARKTMLWQSGRSDFGSNQNTSSGFITAGDSITIKTNIRCNNSNMAYFGGNNSNYDTQLAQVWEIK